MLLAEGDLPFSFQFIDKTNCASDRLNGWLSGQNFEWKTVIRSGLGCDLGVSQCCLAKAHVQGPNAQILIGRLVPSLRNLCSTVARIEPVNGEYK